MKTVSTESVEVLGVANGTAMLLARYSDGTTYQYEAPATSQTVVAAIKESIKGPNKEEDATVICAAPDVAATLIAKDATGKMTFDPKLADALAIRDAWDAKLAEVEAEKP